MKSAIGNTILIQDSQGRQFKVRDLSDGGYPNFGIQDQAGNFCELAYSSETGIWSIGWNVGVHPPIFNLKEMGALLTPFKFLNAR